MVQWSSLFVIHSQEGVLVRRDTLIVGGVALLSGVCIGVCLTTWMPWYVRQREVNIEIIRRLSILETVLYTVQVRLGHTISEQCIDDRPPAGILKRQSSDEEDEISFADALSVMDDALSTNSMCSNSQVVPVKQYTFKSSEEVLSQLETLLQRGTSQDVKSAYKFALSTWDENKKDPNYLWRFAQAMLLSLDAEQLNDCDRKQRFERAQNALEIAMLMQPNCAPIHKWMAVLYGRKGDTADLRTRVTHGFKFKEHIDKALRLDDTDPGTYYLKGRWCFEVQKLTWMEKKVAATFVATLPTATLADALAAFLKAEDLYQGSSRSNRVCLAKCYIAQQQYSQAAKWLKLALDQSSLGTNDDINATKEANELWSKYSSHYQPL